MFGVLWFLFWQSAALILILRLPLPLSSLEKICAGSVFGSVLSVWMPVPFSFLFGFGLASHLLALLLGAVIFVLLYRKSDPFSITAITDELKTHKLYFALLLPLYFLCLVILFSHTLSVRNGALYTGQCTYGDMPMHLGFITSIAAQGSFPPDYSILLGERICYPFLCDSISSSLLLLGTPLRAAFLIPVCFALLQVFTGFYLLALAFCKSAKAAVLACILFFLNGGFGSVYFINGYSLRELLTGFYKTPTNLTEKGIRWVNVIADMLIPQRATLFGWAVLFTALLLLYKAVFGGCKALFVPAGILGGLMPMIHTHSYFAFGIAAFCWFLVSGIKDRFGRVWLSSFLRFAFLALVLSIPQLLLWTFRSTGGNDQFLRFRLGWVNEGKENPILFWLKNAGIMALIIPVSFIVSKRKEKAFVLPALVLFLLAESIVFQPNVYDNNKLLYVSYALFCILSSHCIVTMLASFSHKSAKALVMALLFVLCTNAAVLTLTREVVSGMPAYAYRLFTADSVRAAEFIRSETDPDSLFLTATEHNNAVAALTGRNITCGSPSYLYYHGLNYAERERLTKAMLTDSALFEENKTVLGIDYVYIGENERVLNGCIISYLEENYDAVFVSDTVSIYRVD